MRKESLLLTILFLGLATTAWAQQPSLQNEAGLGLSRVLAYGGVEKEIGMTELQSDQLNGLWNQVQFKLRYKFRDFRNSFSPTLSESRQDQVKQDLQDAIGEVREYEMERLEEVLSASQIDRLKQIRMQAMDRKGNNLQQLIDELKLSESQLEDVDALKKELQEAVSALKEDAKIDRWAPNEIAEARTEIELDFKKKFQDILTYSQKATLDRLKGPEFEFQVGAANANSVD